MQAKNRSIDQSTASETFTTRARRKQIVAATIDVLANYGYSNTTFARIAQRAGINSGLISYHFADKNHLLDEVYQSIYADRLAYIQEHIAEGRTATDQLRLALESDLHYMGTQPHLFRALIEVLFSQRNEQGLPKYMPDADPPMFGLLVAILKHGQQTGEFKHFDAYYLALVLDGARDQFLAQLPTRPSLDLAAFTKTFITFALRVVQE